MAADRMNEATSGSKERDDKTAALAATLPEDRPALLDIAAEAVAAINAAILDGDEDAAKTAAERYEAVVFKLNGNTFFGCMARGEEPEAGGILAERHCSAAPGTVPMWGQCGEFLITVSGVRAVVQITEGFGRLRVHLQFHVVDADRPFISETGYRSHFDTARAGCTVEEVAREVFAAYLAKERRPLAPEYRARRAAEPPRPWLADITQPTPEACAFVETSGQVAFGF